MRRTFIVSLGTAACGALLHFRQRRDAELRRLNRESARASTSARPALEHRFSELEGAIRVLAIDLDGTDSYRLPTPLETKGSTWNPGEAHKVSLHPREFVERFRAGLLPGIDQINPETLRGLDAENASGGARPNADLAMQVAAERVIGTLRQGMVELLKHRHALTSSQDHGIRVFLLAGTFGGTGSGAYERVKNWLLRTGDELGVHLELYPMLLLPGAHAPKDPANSYANSFAVLKELAADSTGSFWRVNNGARHRYGFRAPFLLSDVNNAPGGPRVLSDSAFLALAGDIVYELTATPLGSHLDAQIGDFGVAGTTPTLLGEPRQARSAGMSTIFLDIERQELYSRARLVGKFLDSAAKSVPEGVLRPVVRAFLEGNALVFQDGRNDLAGHLLNQCAAREQLSLPRLRSLFSVAIRELPDSRVMTEGRSCLEFALSQCGDFDPALERHASELIERTPQLVTTEVCRVLTDHRFGPASASQWLAIAGGVTDAMLAAAGNELGQLQTEVQDLDGRIRQAEEDYLDESAGLGAFSRLLHRSSLARAASAYRANLEAGAVARVRARAVACAIRVLNGLRQAIHQEIHGTSEPILAALAACAEVQREDRRRAAAHSLEFGCPNGIALLTSESDLGALHARCFAESDEVQIVHEIYSHLGALPAPVEVLRESDALVNFFRITAPRTLMGARLDELNVIDEVCHRFPSPAHLGSILRERDIEAYERLPLAATSDQTSGVTLIRLAGLDSSRLERVRAVLDANQTERSVRYLPVDTGDRQRLTFFQVRAVFPFSDWRGFSIARGYYESVHTASPAEKQHVYPGHRYLPVPGARMEETEVAGLLVRAWTLDRLSWSENPGWTIHGADGDTSVPSQARIEPQLAYTLAVDLVSSFGFQASSGGLSELRRRLNEARGNVPALSRLRDSGILETTICQLEAELRWWERNRCSAGEQP